ncbi:putative RNA methyltransferase [Thiopseudomonas alkaliphila]|uniref:putative RNA methyltransferase n=1 Tax=Thiopseudomonas alkaliphila TaxID=1697053 RepID=UPI00069D9078|nr:methyltransferase domain-containing protein [Thiopseudomonas alkaliphila]AKX52247.1 SAM-dependent methyltransferase [Thiopseudomonas alkaliphila]
MTQRLPPLICPLCRTPLKPHLNSLRCEQQHNFDRAKQGYYHLLPVQHKKSREPGDNQAMVEARRRFLGQQFYLPIAEQLSQAAQQIAPNHWLDIGCGEGFYTQHLGRQLSHSQGIGLDISKEAVKHASSKHSPITWLVASMNNLPVADQSIALITSLFSPLDWQECARVLAPNGQVLKVSPASQHLIELRQQLYAQVHAYDDNKHAQEAPKTFNLSRSEYLSFSLELPTAQDRADLLAMTPHGWRAAEEKRQHFINHPQTVTVAVRFDWFSLS